MVRTSEFVSLGHPDKTADFISSYILDRYISYDPNVRYAVEVQMKGNFVSLAGEVSSSVVRFDDEQIADFVRQAVREIGYTHDYAKEWGKENAPDADSLEVAIHIGQQSPDISRGVDMDGWGDQGIFWGMATDDAETDRMPKDIFLASSLGRYIFERADVLGCGLDIKTQVELTNGRPTEVVVAAPSKADATNELLLRAACLVTGVRSERVIINGTGTFVRHSSMGDCGTTGRKLAVDFYGGNCFIGGGSPWTKDGTKADVALNLYARKIALREQKEYGGTVFVSISSVIGKREIIVSVLDGMLRPLRTWNEARNPNEIIDELGLRNPCFASMCRYGLFSA